MCRRTRSAIIVTSSVTAESSSMGRYPPPQPKGSPYLTPAGYRRLQQELDALWKRRVEVTQALAAAAAEGDRSENAEYIYRKKELREIDRRIRYLQKRLPELTVVMDAPLARALLKKAVDDEVSVPTPAGPVVYYVVEVTYD